MPPSLLSLSTIDFPESPTSALALAELERHLEHLNRGAGQGVAYDRITIRHDELLPPQAYRLTTTADRLTITAGDDRGLLYGVYGLLEHLGMGFYNGGDTYPDLPVDFELPDGLNETCVPAFSVRGNMLHYNFLCGPTCWGLSDYKFYFDQLAKQRMNTLLMHWYDGEPGAPLVEDGHVLAGGPTPSALDKPWGALAAWRTVDYPFEMGRYFSDETFTSPMGDGAHPLADMHRSQAMFREAIDYAHVRGVRVAAGFEAPNPGDPTDPLVRERFIARIDQFLEAHPNVDYLALWQHESGGCVGTAPPEAGTPAGELLAAHREHFAALGNERRVWEAVRYGSFVRLAAERLRERAPQLRLVVIGWGGDRWMRFADFCLAYDSWLPADVIFCCHDNIDGTMGPTVSEPWGQLPPGRERWAMPWIEGDTEDCWTRQPNVESLGSLAPDALAKGCQGFLNLQWRTRDIEEENAYSAQFAWDPSLTPADFYKRFARNSFGDALAVPGAEMIGTLQNMGMRWTGIHGAAECSTMRWTGWSPPYPLELDAAALLQLAGMADEAAHVLSAMADPVTADGADGAFHLQQAGEAASALDLSRPGVAAFAEAAAELRAMPMDAHTREALMAIHERLYAARAVLVHSGMVGTGYRAVDGCIFLLHHLLWVAGAARKHLQLSEMRTKLDAWKAGMADRPDRLERLEFLAASMDFVTAYDRVAVLLREGSEVSQAITALAEAPDRDEAARLYTRVVGAGMVEALRAQTRKLTTRCEWGVLTTVLTKPVPLYLDTLALIAKAMPVAPPRELRVFGSPTQVWLAWERCRDAAGYHVYRRLSGDTAWHRLTSTPALRPLFVDSRADGLWRYAVSTVAADGWESPKSHLATAGDPLRIVAPKPPSSHRAGEPWLQTVSVIADRELREVRLHVRGEHGREPRNVLMRRIFRDSWQGELPGDWFVPGVVSIHVEAIDESGRRAHWPTGGDTMPWTVTVL